MDLRESNIDVYISSELVPLLDDLAHRNRVNDNARIYLKFMFEYSISFGA